MSGGISTKRILSDMVWLPSICSPLRKARPKLLNLITKDRGKKMEQANVISNVRDLQKAYVALNERVKEIERKLYKPSKIESVRKRRLAVENALKQNPYLNNEELAERFSVTNQTISSDRRAMRELRQKEHEGLFDGQE